MKITAQEEYGLRCLVRLAQSESKAATLPELSEGEGLSVPYVAKLMAVLRDSGLVDSARGRSGGYRLAKPAEEIGLGSLLLVLGEPLFDEPSYCDRHSGTSEDGCVHKGACSLKGLWSTLETWMRQTLDQITLADLLQNQTRIKDLLRQRLASAVFQDEPELIPLNGLK
ncbi:MAG: Rrf2 family transcriptional regulator [Gemmataceae bacterium]